MASPDTTPSLEQLLATLKGEAGDKRLPPVDQWNPAHCGDIGLAILADGAWKHEGVRITREALVRLFSTILRKDEDGRTYLVTPGEKIVVHVEDAPFVAVRVDRHGNGPAQTLAFTTNVGDVVTAGPEHPLRISYKNGEPRPYVLVRGRLEARILRAPFYEMAQWAEPRDAAPETEPGADPDAESGERTGERLGVWSGGTWWELERA